MNTLMYEHFNRLKVIIENPNNNMFHIKSIDNMLDNYYNQFGNRKLYFQLKQKTIQIFKN